MLRINSLLFGLTALFYLVGIWVFPFELNSRGVQHQVFLLTGLVAWFAWAEALVIASRPAWLERVAGEPLDRLMQGHRRLGHVMAAAAVLHIVSPLIATAITLTAALPEVSFMEHHDTSTLWRFIWIWLHPIGALTGTLFTLWVARVVWRDVKRALGKLAWDSWERSHRAWAWLFLAFLLHSLRLMKETELLMPLGWLNIAVSVLGAWAAISLLKSPRAGKGKRGEAEVASVRAQAGEVFLRVKTPQADSFRPGCFAYLSFPGDKEEPHPFTVAGSDVEKSELLFWIKEAGGWTRAIRKKQPGDALLLEGPWGDFHPDFSRPDEPQVWLAGGLGLAPFIAWLDDASKARERGEKLPAVTLWWFVREKAKEPILPGIEEKARRTGVGLQVFETGPHHLRADPAAVLPPEAARAEACGSRRFAAAFKKSWKALGHKGPYRSEAC